MAKQKNLRFEKIRNGKPTGRVQDVVDPNSIDQTARKGIPFKRAQQLVNTLEASSKWERVSNKTPVSEGNSTRVKQAKIREQQAKSQNDREVRTQAANAKAIADALKDGK